MKRTAYFWMIGIVSVIGLALAIESTVSHYAPVEYSFCTINETFDCAAVNRGPYSTFLGVPVAVMGVVGYVFFLVGIVAYSQRRNELLLTLMGTAVIVGFAFTLYLIYLEAFVIYAWCIICLGSALCMAVLFGTVLSLRQLEMRPQEPTKEDLHQ